jgi:O-antigen/teichoic acid export membrane protein
MFAAFKDQGTSLLRWSEKYIGTDMVYLASGGVWFAIGGTISTIISIATVLAFANLLPKETYGIYQYVLAVTDVLSIFILSGIDTAVARSTARGQDGALFAALHTKIRWGLIGGALGIIVSMYYFLQGNTLLGWAFIIAGLAIPFWEAPTLYVNYLQGKQRFDLTNAYEVGAQLFAAAFLVPCLFITHNVLIVLAVYFLSWGAARFFFFNLSVKTCPPNQIEDSSLISFGKHLSVMGVINIVASSFDKILVWQALGPASVATYIFAQAMPARAAGLIKIINRIAFPKMAMQEHEVLQQTLMRKVLLLVALSAVGTLVYVLVAPYLFRIFLPQYTEAIFYTQILAALIALQPFSLLSSSLTAQAKKRSLYIFNFGAPLARIALFIITIPMWGLLGAVLTLVIGKIIESSLLTYLFYRS